MYKCFLFLLFIATFTGCVRQKDKMIDAHATALPSLFVVLPPGELDSVLNDPEYKPSATILLLSSEKDTLYDGEISYFKTRGNNTIRQVKKPFAIKLFRKQNLLGLYKSRSFVLLANFFDESHIRNAIAFDLAHKIGLPAPRYSFLSLYINGEYKGLYQMTNKVDVSKHMLNIVDLNELNKQSNSLPLDEYTRYCIEDGTTIQRRGVLLDSSPEDVSGGYLLELVHFDDNKTPSGFATSTGEWINIRSPKYASEIEVDYIKSKFDSVVNALNPSSGKNIAEFIDMRSFALYFLLQEVLQNPDGCINSFHMYKEQGDALIYAGPAWDFDVSINNVCFLGLLSWPNELSIRRWPGVISPQSNILFNLLKKHPQFQDYVADMYLTTFSPQLHDYLEGGTIDSIIKTIYYDVERDNDLYHNRNASYYDIAIQRVVPFLKQRMAFLDWYYQANSSDRVCITDVTDANNPRYLYNPAGHPFALPETYYIDGFYNNSPVPVWYYAGTDSIMQDGVKLYTDCEIELRWQEPTWQEVLSRRIRRFVGKMK